MNLYLSSFRIGERGDDLRRLAAGRRIGFIPNALDHVEPEARERSNALGLDEIRDVGLEAESLDLREYFGRTEALRARIDDLGGVWVRGGNTFVLRQAMSLSGFDEILVPLYESEFLYAGYSAGVCVLAPGLEGLQHVDDPTVRPYPGAEVIWEGLAILEDLILPHYRSDHPESPAIDREVEYCTAKGIPFKTLRDGEVLILEGFIPAPPT